MSFKYVQECRECKWFIKPANKKRNVNYSKSCAKKYQFKPPLRKMYLIYNNILTEIR